uniref:Uncharacterized protein n=1 Tax=Heterorhabditis bacteriophora TaxID=37862 RepID=A0A1I7WZ78_HETBA
MHLFSLRPKIVYLKYVALRDEDDGSQPTPEVVDLPPILPSYLPKERLDRPAIQGLLHNPQIMGSLEKLISDYRTSLENEKLDRIFVCRIVIWPSQPISHYLLI